MTDIHTKPMLRALQGGPDRTINPAMVTLARESAGLTQGKLAKLIGTTQSTVSKVEHDQSPQGLEFAKRLSKALGEPVDFFFEQAAHVEIVGLYRKRAVGATLIRQIRARIRRIRMLLDTLLRGVDFPECQVPKVDLEQSATNSLNEFQRLAERLRIHWHVPPGPVTNVVELAERLGVLVIPFDFGTTKIDGLSVAHLNDGLPPMIFLSPNVPGDRQRFTMAHELSHIVLHHHVRDRLLDITEAENEANKLAAELLLPAGEIKPHLHGLNLRKAARLKLRWRVSMQAIIQRAHSLGVISNKQRHSLFVQMNQKNMLRTEAVHVDVEHPTMFRELFDLHIEEFGYTNQQLCRALKTTEERLHEIGAIRGLRLVSP